MAAMQRSLRVDIHCHYLNPDVVREIIGAMESDVTA